MHVRIHIYSLKVQQNERALLLELGKRGHDEVYK